MGLGQGWLVWRNRWHIVCRKHRRLGFDTRGTPKRLKQKRVKNSKVVPKKLRNSLGEKGYEKLAAKVGMFLAHKVMPTI
jgi:hypothetical protein